MIENHAKLMHAWVLCAQWEEQVSDAAQQEEDGEMSSLGVPPQAEMQVIGQHAQV